MNMILSRLRLLLLIVIAAVPACSIIAPRPPVEQVPEGLISPIKISEPLKQGGSEVVVYQTVPILCYHQFSQGKNSNKISLSAETFERQMAYLKEKGFITVSLDELYDFLQHRRNLPDKSVVITIDDGWKTTKTIALPILKKYGMKAILFVYTDLVKAKPNKTTLSWQEVQELQADGTIDIQAHSVTHADLTTLSDAEIEKEVAASKKSIEDKSGSKVRYMAYPYGTFDRRVIEALERNGYKAGLTVIKGSNAFYHHPFALNRTMIFNNDNIDDFAKILVTERREEF